MYLALEKDNIRKNYTDVKRMLEERLKANTVRTDTIELAPAVMDSIDDTTGMVCKYGTLVLPRFRGWIMPYDEVTLTAQGRSYRPENTSKRQFTPDILLYGRVSELTGADDDMLLRTFGIDPDYAGPRIGSHNIRNLLQVGQNGSFKEDGLYTILVNEELMREAFLKRQLQKTA